ncbi:MAG TPA: Fic family protein [Streptosporangiaceae bacterium]
MQSGPGSVPRTAAGLAELEARYLPFASAEAWRDCHVDEPRWTRYTRVLTRRIQAAGASAWPDTQDRLIRAAALDSTALDGLFPANSELTTRVLASSIAAPADAQPAGDDVADLIDVVAECHRRALVLASEAAASGRAVDPHLIAVLQDVITESQVSYTVSTDAGVEVEVELPRRQYKPVSNYLQLPDGELAVFAPASAVAGEMERLCAELGSASFAALHPLAQAAYAHYGLTAIHPFADGNGRLARTLASVFLFRSAGLPLVIFADQWPGYYQALHRATGARDFQPLVDLVSVTAMAAADLAAGLLARPSCAMAELLPARQVADGAAPREWTAMDAAARGLIDALAVELRDALVSPPTGVRLAMTATRSMPAGHVESAYRMVSSNVTGRHGVRVAARLHEAADSAPCADLEFVAMVSELPDDLLPVAIRETGTGEWLEFALDDAYPLVLEPTALRIRLWALRLLAEALAALASPSPAIPQ